ncbi:MAG: hypothetical protein TREMPRED_000674 [Tremellales sp. Tagirdzhanova-0007]|nr:MAG: hypothetical protein TREMPRED_000674 [Tremellales sp. Tagirdzhanova-0007]
MVAWAWTKEDHEIFDLVSALEAAEGRGTSFYSHIGVSPSASPAEITKAYRRKSLELHPDKNPGVKGIQGRFERLGVIAQILRSPTDRERYDFFNKNGVPTWRGTGYYYSRFRPTLLHTLSFLVVLSSGFHYLVMRLNYARDRRRVGYFDRAAKTAAGYNKDKDKDKDKKDKERFKEKAGNVKEWKRKVKVPMVEGSEFAGTLELVVEGDEVFLPHDDGSLTPLAGLATPPSMIRTWPFLLLISLFQRSISALPESVQDSLPLILRPATAIKLHEDESNDTPPTLAPPRVAGSRESRRSKSSTPRDSPVTTELESDASGEAEELGNGNGETAGEGKKKKKRGVGKAGGMRRRKMALNR